MSKGRRDKDSNRESRNARLAKQAERQERDQKRMGYRMYELDPIDDANLIAEEVDELYLNSWNVHEAEEGELEKE